MEWPKFDLKFNSKPQLKTKQDADRTVRTIEFYIMIKSNFIGIKITMGNGVHEIHVYFNMLISTVYIYFQCFKYNICFYFETEIKI